MSYPYAPQFEAVEIIPNPAIVGEALQIVITVVDAEIIPQPVWAYANELYSGEEVMAQ